MQDNKTAAVNTAEVEQKMSDSYRIILKQRSAQYMPQDPNTVEAQNMLLTMIEGVLPPVSICIKNAQTQLWPQVNQHQITAIQAAQICAGNIEKLIGITKVENLNLTALDPEILTKAWAALAYFQKHSKDPNGSSIGAFRQRIASVLMEKEYSATASQKSSQSKTDDSARVITQDVPKPDEKGASSQEESGDDWENTDEHNTVRKKPTAIIAVILVLILAVGGFLFYQNSRVNAVQDAISEIGTVTMESAADIELAEQLYAELGENLQTKVENYDTLAAARAEYERLSGKIQEAVDAIRAIGTVTLSSDQKIEAARAAYAALEEDMLTEYVAAEYETLISAEAQYQKCYAEFLYDTAMDSYKAGKYSDALPILELLVEQYPDESVSKQAVNDAASCLVYLAQAAYDEKDYETAVNSLKQARENYSDSEENQALQEKLEEKLSKLRPDNGEVLKKNLTWGYGELTVTAGTHDICYKLVSQDDPGKIVMVYVRAGKTETVKIKNGDYSFYYTSGEYWYGDDVGFGADAVYKKANDTIHYTTTRSGNTIYYKRYTLELYTDTTSNFTTSNVSSTEFWS